MTIDKVKDEVLIRDLYQAWKIAVEESDRKAYVTLLDEAIRMIPPGAADIVGRDAYAEFLIPVFQHATYKIVPLGELEMEITGDFAFVRYDYVVNITFIKGADSTGQSGALKDMSNNMKYADVLRRQTDGNWKVFRHMWNDNIVEADEN